jgi:hypothetical protein
MHDLEERSDEVQIYLVLPKDAKKDFQGGRNGVFGTPEGFV